MRRKPLQCGPRAPPAAERKGRKRGRKPRRTGHNLLLRLAGRKADVLRFLNDPRVPFTNNQAERDLRMMKVKQKISGGFRSLQGAMDFAVIRSFISTAKKPGWNVITPSPRSPKSWPRRCERHKIRNRQHNLGSYHGRLNWGIGSQPRPKRA